MRATNSKHNFRRRFFVAVAAVAVVYSARADKPISSALQLVCLAEYFVVYEGEPAVLNAWAKAATGEAINFEWTDAQEKFIGRGPRVTWDLSTENVGDELKRTLRASVSATTGAERERCTVDVILASRPPKLRGVRGAAGSLEARRRLLIGDDEEQSYGRNSYLLFTARPSIASDQQRYLSALQAVFNLFHEGGLTNNELPDRLHMTHVPVTRELEAGKDWDARRWAQEALAAYNYVRAERLRAAAGLDERGGPYLVAALAPLRNDSAIWAVIDLSGKTSDQVTFWVKHFLWVAAKQRDATSETIERTILQFRNLISIIGGATQEVLDQSARLVVKDALAR